MIKDLQLYDWVSLNGIPVQVDAITTQSAWYQGECFEHKAIELSEEILEKNGFVQQEGDIIALYIDTPYLYAEYLKNIKRIRIFADKYLCGFNVSIDVSYVHELQHALRLCGLNELAYNFVV